MKGRYAVYTIRQYALSLAQSTGRVTTADIVERFGMSTVNAASHLSMARKDRLLEVAETELHGRIVNKITDAGLACIGTEARPPVFDCSALCAAFGYPA
jgi:hypothetical protein